MMRHLIIASAFLACSVAQASAQTEGSGVEEWELFQSPYSPLSLQSEPDRLVLELARWDFLDDPPDNFEASLYMIEWERPDFAGDLYGIDQKERYFAFRIAFETPLFGN